MGKGKDAAPAIAGQVVERQHGGEGALDRVGRAQVLPVLGGELVEGQQAIPVLDQVVDGLVVLGAVGLEEEVEGGLGIGLGLGQPGDRARRGTGGLGAEQGRQGLGEVARRDVLPRRAGSPVRPVLCIVEIEPPDGSVPC